MSQETIKTTGEILTLPYKKHPERELPHPILESKKYYTPRNVLFLFKELSTTSSQNFAGRIFDRLNANFMRPNDKTISGKWDYLEDGDGNPLWTRTIDKVKWSVSKKNDKTYEIKELQITAENSLNFTLSEISTSSENQNQIRYKTVKIDEESNGSKKQTEREEKNNYFAIFKSTKLIDQILQ